MKLTRTSLACLLFCLTAQIIVPAQQDAATRVTAALNAIVAGDNNAARRQAIVAQLKAVGVDPVEEPFGEGRSAGANVVVTLPGSGPRKIVIGAHLDRVNAGRGAVDNGAACAALIELAAVFKASPLTRTTLQIVFFDREEVGLVGSRMYFSTPGHRADYAINLDIFAYGDTIFATGSRPDGVLLRSLRAVSESVGLPARDVPPDRYPNSDHKTMMSAQIETLGIALIDKADVDGVLASDVERLPLGSGPRILRIIHSRNDNMDAVRADQMARGITFVEQLIRRVDAND